MSKNSFGRPAVTDVAMARRIAYRVLRFYDDDPSKDSRDMLRYLVQKLKADEADGRLAATIVLGVFRFRPRLDAIIASLLSRPDRELAPFMRTILRMAAYQQFYTDRVPAHAICNESVGLVAYEGYGADNRLRGFANALVRRIVETTDAKLLIGDFAEEGFFPTWITGVFKARFGVENLERILRVCNSEPPVALRINSFVMNGDEARAVLDAAGIRYRAGSLVKDAIVLTESSDLAVLLKLPAFANGAFYIQDEGSQYVSIMCEPKAGERILDLCAAPGGKATHLAELTGGAAQVVATDSNSERLRLVHENMERLQTQGVQVVDWTELRAKEYAASFDLVLVDAPCSGLGTLRRNPEIKWRLQYDDLLRLAELQSEILAGAARFVKPGGRIVYSTCSVSKHENEQVIDRFLSSVQGWQREAGTGDFCSWPEQLGVDGFSVSVLRNMAG